MQHREFSPILKLVVAGREARQCMAK